MELYVIYIKIYVKSYIILLKICKDNRQTSNNLLQKKTMEFKKSHQKFYFYDIVKLFQYLEQYHCI